MTVSKVLSQRPDASQISLKKTCRLQIPRLRLPAGVFVSGIDGCRGGTRACPENLQPGATAV